MRKFAYAIFTIFAIGLSGLMAAHGESGKTIKAAEYEVMKQIRRPYQGRNRMLMEILAPEARETDVIIKTMMKAAVIAQRETSAHIVSVSLYRKKKDSSVGQIQYSVDGCGWTKDKCGGFSPWKSLLVWRTKKNGMLVAVKKIPKYLADYSPPSRKQVKAAQDNACSADLDCWDKKHRAEAMTRCQIMIEIITERTGYNYKWTNGWFEHKFSSVAWRKKMDGILAYWGNKMQVQNKYGAWIPIRYGCAYNPATKKTDVISMAPMR